MTKNLDNLYRSLLLALGQECEHYQDLLRAMDEEKQVVVDGALEPLLDFNRRNERLLLSLRVAAQMRMEALREIAAALSLSEPVTMTQLIARSEGETRKSLTACREKFSDLLARIRTNNAFNRELIDLSLRHVNNTIHYVNSLTSSSPNYNPKGQIKAGILHGRLISEAG